VRQQVHELEYGRCAVVALDDDELAGALAALPEEERAFAAKLGAVRRRELVTGRTALRLLIDAPPVLADDRGAPRMPPGWVGSISHKGALAAALVAPAKDGCIGVDLERADAARTDIARRILTPREQDALPDRGPAVTLRFAIKEAIYKAVDPFVRRYVGFTEVELDVDASGACAVTVIDVARLPVTIEARWRVVDGHWLAIARARPI
jgi:4'-phosphopantetheinyl transferase EntD